VCDSHVFAGVGVPRIGDGSASVTASRSSSSGGIRLRHLLQNQQYMWPRDSAAITSTLALVTNLVASGNGAAAGIKAGARGLEIARLASNKEANPSEFDRPAAPVQRPARQANALGR
jgi:hypothetical protein